MDYKEFIVNTLQESGEIAKSACGKVTGEAKKEDSNQVLTETDLEIGKLIISRIEKNYPGHNIIDEETGVKDKKSEFTWVTDPIDGTSNFASGIPTYGIMIGLLERDLPLVCGIALPSFNNIYYARKGKGAYCDGKRIYATKETQLLSVLVAYGIDGHKENPEFTKKEGSILTNIILNCRNLRSSNSCHDVAMVAKGSYGAYINQTQKIWDNVAEHLLVEEAGAKVTDIFGKPLDYNNPLKKIKEKFTFFAAPPRLHKQLLEIINQAAS
ncbi:hypothetical protein A2774_05695 [Candidatus Roizmanbacteria bacterium RIFCSPHIGHO2_01_FULL_39_12c]|uniref:Inositol-1-monophosphatase n=1 Tax=Candidatus Roizmanbacteria bacterium RIFCSPHIGHO2_01_FULL_39_12c TaxID=1802031 RepID=A0A1F7G8D0_9BACT|nr:MAG: hypothetical protein A2774_05695 [Candidatus Roizmanbacteria bacterium RIFCSPHIGHO2_01_FULL_39_12c]